MAAVRIDTSSNCSSETLGFRSGGSNMTRAEYALPIVGDRSAINDDTEWYTPTLGFAPQCSSMARTMAS